MTVLQKFWRILVIGLVTIIFTAVWLGIYDALFTFIWTNNFIAGHRLIIPVGVILFSLFVGFCQKYLRAPNMIHGGGLVDAFTGGNKIDPSTFWSTLLSSYGSLLSGVSIGPEGSLGILVSDITVWLEKKLKIAKENLSEILPAGLASAYNGIIGNPIFTALLSTELQGSKSLQNISINLTGGIIGFAFFSLLQLRVFAQYIPFTPIGSLKLEYFLYAFLLGIIGSFVAIFVGISFRFFATFMDRYFSNRIILRTLTAGVITAVVVYFFPEVMFAGESQIFPMVINPASYGIFLLLLFAVLKIILMALAFKSGFIGGPTFPLLFSCTMIGLALSLIFHGIPLGILVMCIEVSAFALAINAPLTAILLVAVVGTADANMVALLVFSAVVGIVLGNMIRQKSQPATN